MIDRGNQEAWPLEVREAASRFSQGDLIEKPPLFYCAVTRYPVWELTRRFDAEPGMDVLLLDPDDEGAPPYGIILSQTCDINEQAAKPKQPWFQVSPVYDASGVLDATQQRQVERHEIVHLIRLDGPALPPGLWVADLRIQLPLEKGCLVGRTPVHGFASEVAYLRFAGHLARRWERPALADNIGTVVESLRKGLSRLKPDERTRVLDPVSELLLEVAPSRLEATTTRLVVVSDDQPYVMQQWFEDWWARLKPPVLEDGLTLLPNRFTSYEVMSAAEYRRAVPLDFRYLSPEKE